LDLVCSSHPGCGQDTMAQEIGSVVKISGNFGFIKPDHGQGPDMFVMPEACKAFGLMIPQIGTPVSYSVVTDAKTGRPRAENVEPVGGGSWAQPAPAWGGAAQAWSQPAWPQAGKGGGANSRGCTGTFVKNNGKFGFVQQDSGGPDMFIMPEACIPWGQQLPEVGERLMYDVVCDVKTGRPRCENAQPLIDGTYQPAPTYAPAGGKGKGKGGRPGPYAAGGFGGYGTAKPSISGPRGPGGRILPETRPITRPSATPAAAQETLFAYAWGQHLRKSLQVELDEHKLRMGLTDTEWFERLAIVNRNGTALAMPLDFDALESEFPLEVKLKGGGAAAAGDDGDVCFGTMQQIKGNFGFIKQDSGDADMFVMPGACGSMGEQLPEPGSRLKYTVVLDPKTGRPRAENVEFAEGLV